MIDIISGKDTDTGSVPNAKKDSKAGFVVTLLCLMAVAIGGGYWVRTHGKPAATAVDPQASEDAVRTVDGQWAKAAAAHDVDGTVAFYSDDAIVMPPNSPMVQDKASERKAWAAILVPGADMSWTAGKVVASNSGEIVYDVGMYTLITKATKGKPQTTDGGKYLTVWKKQADGTWKAVASTWSSDKPAPVGKKS